MARHSLSRLARTALIAFGLFEIVAPRPVIDACERIGLENPAEGRLRSEALTLARLEGALFVWELRRGRQRTPMTSSALTVAGLLAALAPRPLIRFSQSFAYENPHDLQLKPWVVPAARALGVLYLAVVALAARRDTEADEPDSLRGDDETSLARRLAR